MTPQALAWAWLQALPARPFALLDSTGSTWKKRFSLLAGEPLFTFEGRGGASLLKGQGRVWKVPLPPERAFSALGRALERRAQAGFWPLVHAEGYEAGRRFERLPRTRPAPVDLPDWWAFLPSVWAWWDVPAQRWKRSMSGLDAATARRLERYLGLPGRSLERLRMDPSPAFGTLVHRMEHPVAPPPPARSPASRAPQDSMGRVRYQEAVGAVRRHILAGDIYQANLAHTFSLPYAGDGFDLYRRLSAINPSPMAAYVDTGRVQVVSASPERFFRVDGRRVETWPIAGTAPRRGRAGERAALKRSAKDRAEHVMLVDLERNDLGRVCVPGSVRVPAFETVHSASHVHHLVSRVTGMLLPGKRLPELLAAGFPGGSITGAPKVRCMEIISALEQRARGWYTGSLGWWDPRSGRADGSILIRTAFLAEGKAHVSVGAGIVLDSDAAAEWKETLDKAAALLQALGGKR